MLLGAAALRADDSLVHARRAQALLGPGVWSQVIRIENDAHPSRYPRTLHALVFELEGVLWFYTDTDGTQSFSLHRGRLAEEKADFRPLLRDIEPGFARWRVVPGGPGEEHGEVPNGCFIESVAAWRARLAQGGETAQPQLLSFYVDTWEGRIGHTVLTYTTRKDQEVIDPEGPAAPRHFSAALAGDPLALARAVRGGGVTNARLLPLDVPLPPSAVYVTAITAGEASDPTTARRGIVTLR